MADVTIYNYLQYLQGSYTSTAVRRVAFNCLKRSVLNEPFSCRGMRI